MKRKNAKAGKFRSAPRARMPRSAEELFSRPKRFQDAYSKTVNVVSMMRSERISLRQAARFEKIDPRTVLRFGRSAFRKNRRGRYSVRANDKILRTVVTPIEERLQEITLRGLKPVSEVARHSNAVQRYIQTGDSRPLKRFTGKKIVDINGNEISLLTDTDALDRLANAGVLSFETIYARSA
jgi:hypothetical protein